MDGLDTFWYAILLNLLVVVAELEAQRLRVAVIQAFRRFCVVGGITTLRRSHEVSILRTSGIIKGKIGLFYGVAPLYLLGIRQHPVWRDPYP